MSFKLPLYLQEKRNTCALACLRMVLAAFGTNIEERELEGQARIDEEGTPIEELERLAQLFGLDARIEETTVAEMKHLLEAGKLPIAYLDRAVFELRRSQRVRHRPRDAKFHSVIPVRVTQAFISFHNPLAPRIARKSIDIFRQAHRLLGSLCVVCSKG